MMMMMMIYESSINNYRLTEKQCIGQILDFDVQISKLLLETYNYGTSIDVIEITEVPNEHIHLFRFSR